MQDGASGSMVEQAILSPPLLENHDMASWQNTVDKVAIVFGWDVTIHGHLQLGQALREAPARGGEVTYTEQRQPFIIRRSPERSGVGEKSRLPLLLRLICTTPGLPRAPRVVIIARCDLWQPWGCCQREVHGSEVTTSRFSNSALIHGLCSYHWAGHKSSPATCTQSWHSFSSCRGSSPSLGGFPANSWLGRTPLSSPRPPGSSRAFHVRSLSLALESKVRLGCESIGPTPRPLRMVGARLSSVSTCRGGTSSQKSRVTPITFTSVRSNAGGPFRQSYARRLLSHPTTPRHAFPVLFPLTSRPAIAAAFVFQAALWYIGIYLVYIYLVYRRGARIQLVMGECS
ncbi:uncharacterized protein LOC129737196 [Falco cherrug]|uniref:uncharacterized protein LOC129737196 n=1 Tax=Falco cherrug TaxID=345164 RepID=UPI00247AE8E5|nr:uncharacterized protein LOC129737196 [Falco cherrug]